MFKMNKKINCELSIDTMKKNPLKKQVGMSF